VKSISKVFAPHTVVQYGKRKKPGQRSLFEPNDCPKLPWRSETTKLVELVAALSESNVFGEDVTRKELWNHFEHAFDIRLENAERSLSQMKYRKIRQAKFLDDLKDGFVGLMEKGME